MTHEPSSEETRVWLEAYRGQDLTDPEVEGAAEHLAGRGAAVLELVLAQLRQEDETLLAIATQALKRWGKPWPVKPLLALLRDPEVEGLAKGLILLVLEAYGLDPASPSLIGASLNLEEYPMDDPRGTRNN